MMYQRERKILLCVPHLSDIQELFVQNFEGTDFVFLTLSTSNFTSMLESLLEEIKTENPELLLYDFENGNEDFEKNLETIRKRFRKLPVVIFTTDINRGDIARKHGCLHWPVTTVNNFPSDTWPDV